MEAERGGTDIDSEFKSERKSLHTKSVLSQDEGTYNNVSMKTENLLNDDNTDCIKRIKDLDDKMQLQRDRFKKLKEKYEKQIEEKDDKIEALEESVKEQERQYITLNTKYTKLKASFDDISRELDDQLDKVGFKNISQKMKNKPKENPLEIIIKMKEKEIKNTVQLMEVLRKNNEQLNKNLDNYTNVNFITDLQNKLNMKEKENQELLVEIKILNRGLEEHKRCIKTKKDGEEEYKNLKDELRKAKEVNKEIQGKLKEEIGRHTKTKDSLINLKREVDESKRHKNININDSEAVRKLNSNIELDKKKIFTLNHDAGITNMYEYENPILKRSISKPKENVNLNRSLDKPERKIYSKDDNEGFEKRIETLEKSKQSMENKYKSEIKALTKKNQLQEDQIEYISNQYKESEQKNKILQYQSNDYKNEKKVYQRKVNELQAIIDKLTNSLKEKEQENNIVTGQLKEIKKFTKHNAVPPMAERKANEETLLYLTEIKKVSFTEDDSDLKEEQRITQKEESYEASIILN
jgi:hypothetical protein